MVDTKKPFEFKHKKEVQNQKPYKGKLISNIIESNIYKKREKLYN